MAIEKDEFLLGTQGRIRKWSAVSFMGFAGSLRILP